MEWVRAAWRWWQRSPARNVVFAVVMTAITVWGSYGEGHPHNKADIVQFHGPIPEPSAGALLLVAAASLALIWRNRFPLTVLAVSTVGVLVYTLLGYVNGAALLAPAAAVYAVATRVNVKQALVASGAALAVLLSATAARNPFGTATGGAGDRPACADGRGVPRRDRGQQPQGVRRVDTGQGRGRGQEAHRRGAAADRARAARRRRAHHVDHQRAGQRRGHRAHRPPGRRCRGAARRSGLRARTG